jgi:flagellar assembly protein FliH
MGVIITKDEIEQRTVLQYKFKALHVDFSGQQSPPSVSEDTGFTPLTQQLDGTQTPQEEVSLKDGSTEQIPPEVPAQPSAYHADIQKKDEMIASLLKQNDELTSNFVKLQMKMESNEDQFEQKLIAAKEEALEEGITQGKNEAMLANQAALDAMNDRLNASIATLDSATTQFQSGLETIENELVLTSLDVANEVIAIEVSERGEQIASTLARQLFEEIKDAAKVTIKVNPNNFEAMKENFSDITNVEINEDSAITEGGVVVMSDIGNIEGDIKTRFERVKQSVLGGDE